MRTKPTLRDLDSAILIEMVAADGTRCVVKNKAGMTAEYTDPPSGFIPVTIELTGPDNVVRTFFAEAEEPLVSAFESELEQLLNKHCIDNRLNTPDFLLARFLVQTLDQLEQSITSREQWFGYGLRIGGPIPIDGEAVMGGTGDVPDGAPLEPRDD